MVQGNSKKIKLSKRNRKFAELAHRVAVQSDYPQFKHGAVLVKGSSVINTAYNKGGYNSFGACFRDPQKFGTATLHAELGSVLNVDRTLTEGATVFVVRVNRQGEFRLSRPCEMCAAAMKFCGVKRVIYSTNEGDFRQERL